MFCWRVHVGQGKERTISCKSKGCGERVPAFVRQGARAEVVVPGAQDATGSTGGVNCVPRGEVFRQESFCFQGRGVLELSFLESNKRRPRGEEFREDILTAAGLTKATDIPGEEGERFR